MTRTTTPPATERDPMGLYVRLGDGGRIRSERDGVVIDLQHLHERVAYLKRRLATLRHWTLAKSSGAAYDAMELDKELAKLARKTAKLWKRLDEFDAAAPPA